jgi:hypothetical protein
VPLTGTTQAVKAYLDHRSALGAAFAQVWFRRAGSPKVPVSGVIRRALAVYLCHLERPDVDPAAEVRAARSACVVSNPDEDTRAAAWRRMELHAQGNNPLPTFRDVLYGPQEASSWASFEGRVDELVAEINREKAERMNGGRKVRAAHVAGTD